MENEFEGTLFFKGEGKKRKLYLNFTTRNDKTWENPIGENLLSDSLKQFARGEKGDGKKSVKLQEQGGRPVAVYLEGETEINKKEEPQADYSKKDSAPSSDKSKYSHQKEFKSDKSKGESVNMKHEFHNPYNFVPAVPRENLTGELADREPSGHDCYAGDKFSGKLTVKMTVKTPLVVIDTARIQQQDDHKKSPVRVDADGKPYIAPTAVKGMLRSAYEAVTNSRMSVFTKHESRLAFRPEVGQGASVVPVRIEEENDQKKIVFYSGTNEESDLQNHGTPIHGNPLCAAWLPRYFKKNIDRNAAKYNDSSLPQHKDKVKCWLEKFEHWRWDKKKNTHLQDFILWRVREIAKITENLGAQPSFSTDPGKQHGRSYYKPLNEIIKVEGIVFISNHNMQRKHDEKVFFKNADSPAPEILTEKKWTDLKQAWKELVENYRAEHEKVKGKLEPVPASLGIAEWSRHIQKSAIEKELKPEMLCYAEVEKDSANNFTVKRLFPVMISRQLFDFSPLELLLKNSQGNESNLVPADDINRLSPSDRVFGWVGQKIAKNGNYRGQIRFGEVKCNGLLEKSANGEMILNGNGKTIQSFSDLPLNILGQPKPQQGRFYVAETPQGEAQIHKRKNEDAGYKQGRGLRGRKVYPHHAHINDKNFWFSDSNFSENKNDWKMGFRSDGSKVYYREYLRPKNNNQQQRDSQNRSIKGWVKPETEFEFDIHFINLSEVELGALIWLLDLPENHFHRFGGGKPLGFGSVSLSLKNSEISNGDDLKDFYGSLDSSRQSSITPEECKSAFEKAVEDAKYQKILESFKAACKGFDDGLPVHYPRTSKSPNPEGKSFEWFVENSSKSGFKLPLPDLSNEIGLPLKPKS